MVNFFAKELMVLTESSHFVHLRFLPTPLPSTLRNYGIVALRAFTIPTWHSHFQADTRLSVLMSGAIHKSLRCSCKQACRAS